MQLPIPLIHLPNRHFVSSSHHSPSFLLTDPHSHDSDIEMIARTAVEYTSLRDIIPEHPPPPPPMIVSPLYNSSWNEIPIKNPLVKQAALAYLQPMSTPSEVGNKGLFDVLKDKCFCRSRGGFGCFDWLNGVVFKAIAEFVVRFCEIRGMDDSEGDEDEDEDEDGVD